MSGSRLENNVDVLFRGGGLQLGPELVDRLIDRDLDLHLQGKDRRAGDGRLVERGVKARHVHPPVPENTGDPMNDAGVLSLIHI